MFDLNFYANIDKWYKICLFRKNILNKQCEHNTSIMLKDVRGFKTLDKLIENKLHNVSGIEISNYCRGHFFYFEDYYSQKKNSFIV